MNFGLGLARDAEALNLGVRNSCTWVRRWHVAAVLKFFLKMILPECQTQGQHIHSTPITAQIGHNK